jgi:hypothetical protein
MAFVILRIGKSYFSLCDLDLHTLAVGGLTTSTAGRSVIKFEVTLFSGHQAIHSFELCIRNLLGFKRTANMILRFLRETFEAG